MSDATGPQGPGAAGGQPSEEELRAALGQMRQGHVGEIVAQVISLLANGAQVKLGRRDARLLIDLTSSVLESSREYLDERFNSEVANVLSQLKMAQVQAEQEVAQHGGEENDLDSTPHMDAPAQAGETPSGDTGGTPGGETPTSSSQGSGAQEQRRSSRLWTPGS